jgi:toxin ParE1/3/4
VSTRITIKPDAELDLLEHFVFIGRDSVSAAERFHVAVRDAFDKLAEMPGMGRLREFESPELADVRSWPVRGYKNYLIFYRPTTKGIDVLRVLHGARDIDRLF